ncbi:MAG: thiamine-phosphate kinase [Planctomycetota bacterium]|nr:thiamine-phosphate kinase [Planctomycetota bacterium]
MSLILRPGDGGTLDVNGSNHFHFLKGSRCLMEREFIRWIRTQLPPDPRLLLGAGDDAAVLDLAQQTGCVVTSDLLMDQVDFLVEQCSPQRIGRKALAVNLSDLAAMAARPHSVVVSLALPRRGAHALAVALYEGILPLAREFETSIAGGDTNTWDGPLVISITAIGETTGIGPVARSGARAGDTVLVTGDFGGSILNKHLDFTPRVHEALCLHRDYQLHALTDVSDGLSVDLSHIVEESGHGIVINRDSIPISKAAIQLAEQTGDAPSALVRALSDGEDFELIIVMAAEDAESLVQQQPFAVPVTPIGHVVDDAGLWYSDERGELMPLKISGYEHRGME